MLKNKRKGSEGMSEKRPEEIVRERLEGFRDGIISRLGEKGLKRIKKVLIAVLALCLIYLALLLCLRIRSVEIVGDVTMFNESEIIRAAEINEGDMLLCKSAWGIERRMKKNMPLIKDVNVKKSIGGKVRIDVEFHEVRYYCKIGDTYYAIDEDLRVLDADESRSKYSAFGATFVRIPEVREPHKGEKLVFYDTVEETDTEGETLYEVKEEKVYFYVTEYLSALTESGFREDSDAVMLDEKFNVTLIYAGKFKVIFGDARDLDVKFRALFGILSEGSMQYASRAVVDLSTPSMATARADEGLDLSVYFD